MTSAVHVVGCAWASFADPGDARNHAPGRYLRQWVRTIGAGGEEGGGDHSHLERHIQEAIEQAIRE